MLLSRLVCVVFLSMGLSLHSLAAEAPPLDLPDAQWQGTRDHVVQEGEALGLIVMQRYPELRGNWQRIIRYIVQINPQAFPDANPDRLQPGAVIAVPDYEPPLVAEPEPKPARLPVIGAVMQGVPTIVDRNQRSSKRIAGDPVHEGDTALGTGSSVAVIRLIDGSVIEIRPDSEVMLSLVAADNRMSGRLVLKLIKGGLRMVSGLFGKQADSEVLVKTPGGVIGVRGTDFAVRHCEGQSCAAETDATGSIIGLLDGALVMDNEAVDGFAIAPRDVFLVADTQSVPEPRPDLAGLLFSDDQWPAAKPPLCAGSVNRTGPRLRCR